MNNMELVSAIGYLIGFGGFLFIKMSETHKYNKRFKKHEMSLKQCIN